jgi:glycosyltransferase involved in cell wall biosynthesis
LEDLQNYRAGFLRVNAAASAAAEGDPNRDKMAAKYHIMFLSASYEVGGSEGVALNLAGSLNGRFRVSGCALFGQGEMRQRFAAAGIETHAVRPADEKRRFDFGLIWRLARLLRRERVDLLHCQNKQARIFGVLAGRLAGVPVVCTRHGIGPSEGDLDTGLLIRLAARWASHHVAVCRKVLRQGIEIRAIEPKRASVIYNGIDTGRFAAQRPPESWRMQPAVIGCVARLSAEKGHRVLLKAVRSLADRGVDFRLRLVGDGPERPALEEEARRLALSDRVDFLGSRSDVAELMTHFRLFVLPSLTEGLPLTVIEAMASGLPVVASDVGGIGEAVRDEVSGLLAPAGTPEALADAIGRLLADPDRCSRMGSEGRRIAVGQFDLSVMARGYAELYEKLLAGSGSRTFEGTAATRGEAPLRIR